MGRMFASLIELNQSTLWVTGGTDAFFGPLASTELVTANTTTPDVNLPFTVSGHCMVRFSHDAFMLIGGNQDGVSNSVKTWIIDVNNRFNIGEGPSLNEGRETDSCGIMYDDYGHALIIVVGGLNILSVEILNTTIPSKWTQGKDFSILCSNHINLSAYM